MNRISKGPVLEILAVLSFVGLAVGYVRIWMGFYTPNWALAACFLLMFVNAIYSLIRRFQANNATNDGKVL